ncbi:1-deoxy-D-xylulose-5-phosphate reductoisomerase [Comamonas serinivorans]|nr:1-deoxy-D-xylulose-5-phosphate reductoisomerase [Comamonas serinivorans]
MQRVLVLGSTGSIGVNTLDVIARHPDRFVVHALTAASRVDALVAQCMQFQPAVAAVADAARLDELASKLKAAGLRTQPQAGAQALTALAAAPEVDTVMAAIVGAAGLAPCMAAARAGKRLLLANKEALVVGGELFLQAVAQGGAKLLPIDSEHSAVFQSLPDDPATWSTRVAKIILTASGGPFRDWAPHALDAVTPAQACAHPNWVMGRKISVDSATMMNKALELIEARYLFGLPPDQLDVVIHPQSVVHSMVQYHDSSVVAQLGTPDMRVPIAYGLSWPERMASGAQALDFSSLSALTFEALDSHGHEQRFPGMRLAWDALRAPFGSCAVLNAANEVAVQAFLDERIRFTDIHRINVATLDALDFSRPHNLEDLLALDREARCLAEQQVQHGLARA